MPSKYIRSTKPRTKPTGKKAEPTGTAADLNMATMAEMFSDEDKAREFLESQLWPEGPVCPHCGEHGAYKLTAHKLDSKRPMRKGVYKCKGCRKQYTVRVGTIFEESKLPLRKWLMAIHLMTSSKKGVSSHQIRRELGVSIKTAWFLTHRIRECMKLEPMAGMLQGVVEADETWVGGKPRPGSGTPRAKSIKGRGTPKQPVAVLVQRDGAAVCKPIANASSDELRKVAMYASPDAVLITDEWKPYGPIGREMTAHYKVNHGEGEYARPITIDLLAHTNTAESFFALLKRGHYGIFHQLSKQHLGRYCDEFSFRWTHRNVSDGHRMMVLIEASEGKRLKYGGPITPPANPATSV